MNTNIAREAERLIRLGKMPSLEECVCLRAGIAEYANHIPERTRREAREKVCSQVIENE